MKSYNVPLLTRFLPSMMLQLWITLDCCLIYWISFPTIDNFFTFLWFDIFFLVFLLLYMNVETFATWKWFTDFLTNFDLISASNIPNRLWSKRPCMRRGGIYGKDFLRRIKTAKLKESRYNNFIASVNDDISIEFMRWRVRFESIHSLNFNRIKAHQRCSPFKHWMPH